MPQICLRVPQNPHTWLVQNAYAYFPVLLSFRTRVEVPVPLKVIFWEDKSKDPCRPLNPWTNSKSHSMSNNSFTKMCDKLYLSFRSWFSLVTHFWEKKPPHIHTHTVWNIKETAKLVCISYYPTYLNSWYKYRLRVSSLISCVIRMNKQLNEYWE